MSMTCGGKEQHAATMVNKMLIMHIFPRFFHKTDRAGNQVGQIDRAGGVSELLRQTSVEKLSMIMVQAYEYQFRHLVPLGHTRVTTILDLDGVGWGIAAHRSVWQYMREISRIGQDPACGDPVAAAAVAANLQQQAALHQQMAALQCGDPRKTYLTRF
eukprot:gene24385-35815_t